jgi:ketosteroid isomerase-like protein
MPLTNKEIVQKMTELFNENNTEALLSFCDDDITWTMAGAPPMIGKDAVRKGLEMMDYGGEHRINVQHMICEGDLVACNGTVQVTKKNGGINEAMYCDIYRIQKEKIKEMTSYVVDLGIKATSDDDTRAKLLDELEATTADLLRTLSLYKDEEINTIPFEGSWSGGQVADHLQKANGGALKVIHARVQPTERPVDKNNETIRNIFLDFSTKLKSPDFILPSEEPLKKDELFNSLKSTMEGLQEGAKNLNLDDTCLDFNLPTIGLLTRLELIYFCIYHTQRHTRQLKNIYSKISA